MKEALLFGFPFSWRKKNLSEKDANVKMKDASGGNFQKAITDVLTKYNSLEKSAKRAEHHREPRLALSRKF